MELIDILRALQQLARSVQAIRSPLGRIIELAFRNMGPVNKADIAHILKKEDVQKTLALEWETALYRHTNGQFVLVCTALPDNAKDAQVLTKRRLINSRQACSFCGLVEGSFAPLELVTARSPVGSPIQGELVHRGCALAYQRLKLISEGK